MESTNNEFFTQIKYEKTSCYFCNEWLETQTFKEHIIHCGQVLEKCPHSCTAYVQRKKMRSHLKECPKIKRESNKDFSDLIELREHENRMLVLEQDLGALRSVLNEEIKQRLHLITDVGSLRKHNQISDEWTQKVGAVLSALKKCLNQETAGRCNDLKKCNEDIIKLFNEYQKLKNSHAKSEMQLEQINNQIIQEHVIKEQIMNVIDKREPIISNAAFQGLALDIESLQKQITKLSNEVEEVCHFLNQNFSKIEINTKEQQNCISTQIQILEEFIRRMEIDLQNKFIANSELNSKQATLDCEVKGMKNIVYETEDKCDKLEKHLVGVDLMVHQTKQDLIDLERHLLYESKILAIYNTRGHLIWKMNEYSLKLKEAKEHETSIQSPMFFNKQFGYTLRLDVHLNGIGTWKHRNIIACLTVVQGEFDTLLQWPCKLQADIILKDQPLDLNEAQDYLKTTIVKKKNDDFHSNQYIHIPHKIIESRHYIRNDSIIFEVRVIHKNKV